MQKRTESEIRNIIKRCLEIENKGGDILSYLRSEHYISPGATWRNFQIGYLGRDEGKITTGKPNPRALKISEEKHMNDIRKKALKDQFPETARCAINIALSGISPMKYLREKGYAQPTQAWTRIKEWCMKNDPESYEKIPKNVKTLKQPKGTGASHREASGGPELPPDLPEPVEAEKSTVREQERPAAAPTCCQPARESGVTVPDELPDQSSNRQVNPQEEKREQNPLPYLFGKEMEFPLKVCGIAGSTGVYGIGTGKQKTMRFKRIDGEKTYELEMSPQDWRRFITETLLVLKAFGA